MTLYSLTFICAFGLLAAVQLPGTSAFWFSLNHPPTRNDHNEGSTTISSADKAEIVNKHNDLRRNVQPPASNMLKMSWSSEAAANAQQWANTCSMQHSSRGSRAISSSGCGENLYMSSHRNSWSD